MNDPRPKVYAEKCETCIFRPGNPMRLHAGRLQDIVRQNLATGTLLTCHKTTYGQAPEEVLCRGFYDAHGPKTNAYRVMNRLGQLLGYTNGFQEIAP